MDEKLLGQALQYHGVDLLYSLKAEHQEQPSATVLSHVDRKHHRGPEIKDAEFQKRVCAFIGRKSDMIFKPLSEEDKNRRQNREIVDDAYAIMPALESFLDVPSHLRRGHFYRSLRPDDCVSGVVLSVLENGLRIQLLCVDKGCARDIDDLDIQAFCPAKELPKLYPNESALEAFQEKDIVRGIVLAVSEESEKIIISLHEKAIPDKNIYPRIGLITEEEFPVHYRRIKQIDGSPFEELLHSILGFNNMGNVKALVEQLGIQEDASHMRYRASLHIPEKEYAEGLRKWQSQKLAYHSVAQGVEMFKSGKYLEALQYFNRALQIDSENVEALVARGALCDFCSQLRTGRSCINNMTEKGLRGIVLQLKLFTGCSRQSHTNPSLVVPYDMHEQMRYVGEFKGLEIFDFTGEVIERQFGCQRTLARHGWVPPSMRIDYYTDEIMAKARHIAYQR